MRKKQTNEFMDKVSFDPHHIEVCRKFLPKTVRDGYVSELVKVIITYAFILAKLDIGFNLEIV